MTSHDLLKHEVLTKNGLWPPPWRANQKLTGNPATGSGPNRQWLYPRTNKELDNFNGLSVLSENYNWGGPYCISLASLLDHTTGWEERQCAQNESQQPDWSTKLAQAVRKNWPYQVMHTWTWCRKQTRLWSHEETAAVHVMRVLHWWCNMDCQLVLPDWKDGLWTLDQPATRVVVKNVCWTL